MILMVYLALISAPFAVCLLIYGIAHKVRQIRNVDDSARRVIDNRQEIRRQLSHD